MPQAFFSSDNSVTTATGAVAETPSELITALLDSSLSVPDFMACAQALRGRGTASSEGADRSSQPRRHDQPPATASLVSTPRTARAIERLQMAGKDSGGIREATLAREFGIDPAHLGRLVRRATGLGFRDWKLGIRLRLAVRALAESDAPVKWVAHESGFASTAQFDRGFRRAFGMTPGEFRRLAFSHVRRPS
ncbi:MAG: helix-turn-helix transcriptional regulator [Acidobacteriota bacterium]